jgi:hypothetical protein
VSFSPEIIAALSRLISSCLSVLTTSSLSGLTVGPRSDDAPEVLGGGISLDNRPFSTPLAPFEDLSRFSRAVSADHLGGGSGRTRSRSRSRSPAELRSDCLKSLRFASSARRSLPEKSRDLSPGLSPGLSTNLSPGLSKPLASGNRESLPSLLSPWRGGCLSSI